MGAAVAVTARTAPELQAVVQTIEGPYSSRLIFHLDQVAGQGWQPAELQTILLDLVTTGDPTRQQALARRVTALLRDRGVGHVYDDWEGQIDQALGWVFLCASDDASAKSIGSIGVSID